MGGIFGVLSQGNCIYDLFFGTDYHSHMGTMRGGLAVLNGNRIKRAIKDITNAQFRSKFQAELKQLGGTFGIGVISDMDDQPLIIRSHLGRYAIVTVGKINNQEELIALAFQKGATHFSEISGTTEHVDNINSTELVATLINQGASFEQGIVNAQDKIEGSCSLLLLTETGIYAARDKFGRTPLTIGRKYDPQIPKNQTTLIEPPSSYAITMETCAFPNLNYKIVKVLGPGEIVHITLEGIEVCKPAEKRNRICGFLWVYYGYPSSSYEGINVELVRYRCGAALAKEDDVEVDYVCGIPDSGTSHGVGYANASHIPYGRPFVKYTPTWPRSFMPQDQNIRDLVAKMKLIPVEELIKNKKLLFCDDSIVRGTQLKDTIKLLYQWGAKEVHMRVACPPLVFGCKFLDFSRSRSEFDLAGRSAIRELMGDNLGDLTDFLNPDSEHYKNMVDIIRKRLSLTTLKYQHLEDLVQAIGLPKECICTYCWDGVG